MADKVQLGDREVTLPPFSGRKATTVGRIIRRVSKQLPELQDKILEYRRTYAQENAQVITRDMALALPQWQERLRDVTDEQWEKSGNELRVPVPPAFEEEIAYIFEEAFDAFEDEVLQLLALAIIPNSDLAEANRQDKVQDTLRSQGERLLDEATMGQLLELAAVTIEHVKEELQSKADPIRRIRSVLRLDRSEEETPEESTPQESTTAATTTSPDGSSDEEATPTSSGSSTPSDAPTGGSPTSRSTGSTSETSLVSAT